MRMMIREYLGMLREGGEFDVLMPDLLREMQIVPLSSPQTGVRQAGVDLAAVGNDTVGIRCLWLFVLKRGDLGRRDWDTQPQSIRPSLEEIKDIYLRSHVAPEHQGLPVRIIVATTGDIKQEIQQNLVGYADRNKQLGLSYDFWNGDHVAALMEEHLLTEHALPAIARSQLRRALALIGEPEYDLEHYFSLLKDQLTWEESDPQNATKQTRVRVRALTTLHLALGILCRWAGKDNNHRNALLAYEITLLCTWDVLRKQKETKNQEIFAVFIRLVETYLSVSTEYFNKVQPNLHTENAVARYFRESALLTERVFEEIGFLGTIGLTHLLFGLLAKNKDHIEGATAIGETLHAFVNTHPITGSPCYDNQCIDISLGLLLFCFTNRQEAAKKWLDELTGRLTYAYRVGKWFPVSTDSFDDL